MIAPILLASQLALCPEYASTVSVWASVSVTPRIVRAGDSVTVKVGLLCLPFDPITGESTGTFGGGTAKVFAGGGAFDCTPEGGIPQIGPCGLTFWHHEVNYTALQSGPVLFDYEGTAGPYQAKAHSVAVLNVIPHGRMHIEHGYVWWYGTGSYSVEGSSNLREWTSLTTITAVDGIATYHPLTNETQRYYRYRTN